MADKVTPTYRVIAEPDENGGWFVYAPAVKGAHSQGETPEGASANIREAISAVLDVPNQSFGIDVDYGLPQPITP